VQPSRSKQACTLLAYLQNSQTKVLAPLLMLLGPLARKIFEGGGATSSSSKCRLPSLQLGGRVLSAPPLDFEMVRSIEDADEKEPPQDWLQKRPDP
jgi:hypothetical protein